MPKEQYMCQLCANHGVFNQPKKGHKQKCQYKTCLCDMCSLNTKRRTLDQIERQLRTVPSTNSEIIPETTEFQNSVESTLSTNNHRQLSVQLCPYTTRKPSSIFTSVKFLIENA